MGVEQLPGGARQPFFTCLVDSRDRDHDAAAGGTSYVAMDDMLARDPDDCDTDPGTAVSSVPAIAGVREDGGDGDGDGLAECQVKELKAILEKAGVDYSDCLEKADLVLRCQRLGVKLRRWRAADRVIENSELGRYFERQGEVSDRAVPPCKIGTAYIRRILQGNARGKDGDYVPNQQLERFYSRRAERERELRRGGRDACG
jgi:hypothetical protein